MSRAHRRAPAAPRRGAQPGAASSTAGCPATTSPSWAGRWPTASRSTSPAATSPPSSPRRWSARRRPRRRRRGARPAGRAPTSGSSRRATSSRARRSASATARCATREHWLHLRNPFRPSWGEPYARSSRADARRGRATPATPPAATRRCCVSHQLPIWIARLGRRAAGGCGTTRASRECSLASLTSLHLRRRRPGLGRLHRAGRGPAAVAGHAEASRGVMTSPPDARPRSAGRWSRLPWWRLRRLHRRLVRRTTAARTAGYVSGDGAVRDRCRRTSGSEPVELSGTTLDGQPLDLADARGKVVVVNVWGSWCAPCRGGAGELQAVHRADADAGRRVRRHQHQGRRAASARRSSGGSASPTRA